MKENISELEDSAVDTVQNGTHGGKKMNKHEWNISGLWVKHSELHVRVNEVVGRDQKVAEDLKL